MKKIVIRGRSIIKGVAMGEALVTKQSFMFPHGIDPKTGVIIDARHELRGQKMTGKVFVFPYGKGSTTGSTWILELIRCGNAPAAMINLETEPIITTGVTLGELFYKTTVPTMDRLEKNPLEFIKTGNIVKVDSISGFVEVELKNP